MLCFFSIPVIAAYSEHAAPHTDACIQHACIQHACSAVQQKVAHTVLAPPAFLFSLLVFLPQPLCKIN